MASIESSNELIELGNVSIDPNIFRTTVCRIIFSQANKLMRLVWLVFLGVSG